MNTLSRHIESLLVKHNCVIVPKLGGFVAHYIPAQFNSIEGCFVPPYRNVAFNSMLAINDGLLIEHYSKIEKLCYTDSVKLIDAHVNQLKETIAEQGEAELVGIGILRSNGEGGYNFEPRRNGIMTPSLYSLEYTEIDTIQETSGTDEITIANDNKRNYIIRLNRAAVNYISAAVIAIMFYFLLAPIGITSGLKHEACIVPQNFVPNTSTSKPLTPSIPTEKTKQECSKETTPLASADVAELTEEVANKCKYVVVTASAIGKQHAEDFVARLQKEGHPAARIIESNTMRRVVIGNFSTEEEARTYLHTLTNDERYADSWVMKL